jgi:hypothetical protein
MVRFLFGVAVFLLFQLANLLGGNVLYAAIVVRLRQAGIQEGAVVALIATNLVLVIATIVVVTFLYFLAFRHHTEKAAALSSEASIASGTSYARRFSLKGMEAPTAVVVALLLSVPVAIYWQINYGPFAHKAEAPLSDSEKKDRIALIDRLMVQLNMMKSSALRARDISENWQYQVQTDPNNFLVSLALVANGFYASDVELKSLERMFAGRKDIADLFKADYPDCNEKSNALYAEISRISAHKGADLMFTLLNDTKLADFRAVVPECEKWSNARIDAVNKKRVEYQ